jgi:hypothetical protein
MAENSIRKQVLEAVRDTLVAYMPAKVPTFMPRKVKWHFTDVFIEPSECPAISILDKGWANVDGTTRSLTLAGTAVGGFQWDRMAVEVQPWLKDGGRDDEQLRAALSEWCGAIKAVVDANNRLGQTKLAAEARSGSNFETLREGTLWFGAGQVVVQVDVFTRQGDIAL